MKILNPKAKESQQQEMEKHKEWLAKVNAGEMPHLTTTRLKILQSPLWQSIFDFLPENRRLEVIKALQNVYMSHATIDLNSDNLDQAMTWEATPQGHDYWADLHNTTLENGL